MHTHACMGSQVCKKRLSSQYCCKCEHRTGRLVRGALRAIPQTSGPRGSEQSPRTSGPQGLREIPQDFRTPGAQSNPPGLQDPRGSEQSPRTSGAQSNPLGLQDPGAQSNPPGLQDPRGSEQSPRTSGPQGTGKVMINQVSTKCYRLYPQLLSQTHSS